MQAAQALTGPESRLAKSQQARAEDAKQVMESISRSARDFGSSISDGAEVTEEGMNQLQSAFQQAKGSVGEFFQQQQQLADFQLQQAQQGVQAAQTELQTQLQLAHAGYANRVETAQAELAPQSRRKRKRKSNGRRHNGRNW